METVGFWLVMFILIFLIPLTMVWMGWIFQTKSAFNKNATAGYRTSMSMKNEETWEFAHLYSGRIYYKMGLMSLLPSVVPMFFLFGKSMDQIGWISNGIVMIQCALLLFPVILTELALRRTFDKYGNRLE